MPAHTLTQGGITRQLIGLTLPLLLGNLIQQFYIFVTVNINFLAAKVRSLIKLV